MGSLAVPEGLPADLADLRAEVPAAAPVADAVAINFNAKIETDLLPDLPLSQLTQTGHSITHKQDLSAYKWYFFGDCLLNSIKNSSISGIFCR